MDEKEVDLTYVCSNLYHDGPIPPFKWIEAAPRVMDALNGRPDPDLVEQLVKIQMNFYVNLIPVLLAY